jgi:hypothetical protein
VAEQGASNGAGQAAGKSFVTFSRPAAQRIAKAVRTVEAGDRNQPGLTFDHPQFGGTGKLFRVCTFTGSWSIGSTKSVTFKYQTTTPNTAAATNLFFPVTSTATLDCAIAKDGTAWFLVDVPFYTASAVFITAVSVGATLNTNTCAITVATTSSTATATFLRIGVP